MNATPNLSPTPTAAPVARGFLGLPCLYCSDTDCVTLDLSDMSGEEALACGQCDTKFSLADVQAKLDAWLPVLAWTALAPMLPKE